MPFKKSRTGIVLAVIIMSAALVFAGCGGNGQEEGKKDQEVDVAFMYIGPVEDAGWTYAHDQGRQYLQDQLDYVDASDYVESVPEEGAESATVLRQLAEKGNDIIFATSFGYMDNTLQVAQDYPDKVFMHCSGYETADNVGTYFGRMYQARYLTGLVAGKATESNVIGYVAAHEIPEVVRGINAFTLGVKEANPEARVRVLWTNTWVDPGVEKRAAETLLDEGADVIAQHQDTTGPQEAAREAGAYSIGYNTDMSKNVAGNETVLTSAIWNWGPYYKDVVESVKNGTWETGEYWGSLQDGVVDIAPFGPMVEQETKELVQEQREKIESGEWDVFYGPIKDRQGEVRVPEGEKMTDQEIWDMDWFVEGVEGAGE